MEILDEIWGSLRRNKMRTVLTGFAVSWGLFMIIALLGAGTGLLNAMSSNAGDILTNVITVYPGFRSIPYDGMEQNSYVRLDMEDVAYTSGPRFSDVVDDVTGSIYYSDTLSLGREYLSANIVGVAPLYRRINDKKLLSGRFLNDKDIEECRKTIVVDARTASSLLGDDPRCEMILGRYVKIAGLLYQVVGIIETNEMMGGNAEVYIPITTMSRIRPTGTWFNDISFSFHGLETEEDNEAFEARYKRAMNARHRAAPEDGSTFYLYNSMTGNMEMNRIHNEDGPLDTRHLHSAQRNRRSLQHHAHNSEGEDSGVRSQEGPRSRALGHTQADCLRKCDHHPGLRSAWNAYGNGCQLADGHYDRQ